MDQSEKDEIEARLQKANYAIKRLTSGDYADLQFYLFGGTSYFRSSPANPALPADKPPAKANKDAWNNSEQSFSIEPVVTEGSPIFIAYYDRGLSKNEAYLLVHAYYYKLSAIFTAISTTLGFDIKPVLVEPPNLEVALKEQDKS